MLLTRMPLALPASRFRLRYILWKVITITPLLILRAAAIYFESNAIIYRRFLDALIFRLSFADAFDVRFIVTHAISLLFLSISTILALL